jgi:DNA (cytosine-5)-methyltransferase 1
MSAKQPFVVDDEDDDPASYIEDEIEVQHYDGPLLCLPIYDAPIDDDEDFSITEYAPPAFVPPPAEFEIPDLALGCGLIKPGNIVELEDDSGRNVDHLISGDFLLVRSIIENMKDGQVVLRGYRMRRCAYLKPTFPGKCFVTSQKTMLTSF